MQGLMMEMPLLVSGLIHHAERPFHVAIDGDYGGALARVGFGAGFADP